MPSGVGSDAGGNIYVAHRGSTGGGKVFRLDDGSSVGHMEPSKDIGEVGLQDIRPAV
jgi:hypothetical protein